MLAAPPLKGEWVCGSCGRQVSRGEVEQQRQLVDSMQHLEAVMSGAREVRDRSRHRVDSSRRTNAAVSMGLGGLFAVFAGACFSGALATAISESSAGAGAALGAFGIFWALLAGLLVWLGRRGLSALRRNERLRASGVRGKATVVRFRESKFMVDGMTKFELALRVEVQGKPAWDLTLNEPVPRPELVYTNATLPVLVDASDPSEAIIDWYVN